MPRAMWGIFKGLAMWQQCKCGKWGNGIVLCDSCKTKSKERQQELLTMLAGKEEILPVVKSKPEQVFQSSWDD